MTRTRTSRAKTLGLIHLGCPKNQVDSEEMLAVLATDGWTLVGDPDEADVLVINTCGFIDAAKEESIGVIRDAVDRKDRGECTKVIVTGCLAQRYSGKLAKDIPGVDAVIGLSQTAQLPAYIRSTFYGKRPVVATPPPPEWQELGGRLMTTPPWTTYLRIGEGCDHRCSFCAIPGFRGDWRSRPAEALLAEVGQLAAMGLKEAVLIGQDTTLYGKETRGEWSLPRLIRAMGKVEGLHWQRLMYAHPGRVTQELIYLFAEVPNLAPYIDMPFQHGDDGVLKRMKRAGNTTRYLEIVRLLRQARPEMAVRSTFLLGFPGETEQEFENALAFLREARLDHVGAFVYSHEDDTAAFDMVNDVPREVAEERRARLMALQAEISAERLASLAGEEIDVLVEAEVEEGQWIGRTWRDAPEVDGCTTLLMPEAVPGDIVRARVVDTSTHDIVAEPVAPVGGARTSRSGDLIDIATLS